MQRLVVRAATTARNQLWHNGLSYHHHNNNKAQPKQHRKIQTDSTIALYKTFPQNPENLTQTLNPHEWHMTYICFP